MSEQTLKIFTLNCWGLRFVSQHRDQRIKLIGQHINDQDYDIVFLQEIWIQSDFERIQSATQSKFKFTHMFRNGSILGNSGLAIFVKWIPKVFHFHPFSVNGSPFRPFHGDWFTSKGVGYVRIDLDSLNLHLFCTHMHAQYSLEERLIDQYSIHRICQSYEMSKFIKLMTNTVSSHSNCKDLIILAGDMNASSKELPYRLLVNLSELNDCHKYRTKPMKQSNGLEAGDSLPKHIAINNESDSEMTDDEHHTCGHRDNTFTKPNDKSSAGKRIDFILYRLCDEMKTNYNDFKLDSVDSHMCGVERLTVQCKDESGLSFSDHQPVVALFKMKFFDPKTTSRFDEIEEYVCNNRSTNGENHSNGDNLAVISGNNSANYVPKGDGCRQRLHVNTGLGRFSNGTHDIESELKSGADKTDRHKLTANVLTDVTETASKLAKTGPLQLKQIASNAIKSKLRSNSCRKTDSLIGVKGLLEDYVLENQWTFKTFVFYFFVFLLIVSIFLTIVLMSTYMTTTEVSLSVLIVVIITTFSSLLNFLSSRQEKNAIKAIVNEMEVEILLNQ